MTTRPKLVGWSPTKYSDYQECPLRAYMKHGAKLCPCCFKEVAIVTYDKGTTTKNGVVIPPESAYCTKKKVFIEKPKALANGITIGRSIELFIATGAGLSKKITNLEVLKIIRKMREGFLKKLVQVEHPITLDESWKPVSKFTSGAWLRTKLDVLRTGFKKGLAEVIDWKTGGIKNGQIRASEKYDDQLSIYTTAALTADPLAKRTEASLVFVEAPDGVDPVVARENCDLDRKGLAGAQKKWSLNVVAMLNDETFAPRPGYYCNYCDYAREKGGPCPI